MVTSHKNAPSRKRYIISIQNLVLKFGFNFCFICWSKFVYSVRLCVSWNSLETCLLCDLVFFCFSIFLFSKEQLCIMISLKLNAWGKQLGAFLSHCYFLCLLTFNIYFDSFMLIHSEEINPCAALPDRMCCITFCLIMEKEMSVILFKPVSSTTEYRPLVCNQGVQ